ncbi:hypothetical protein, partial [Salmonella enterica]|uniref:hypothetical protein n=1 Tax=Salmonella enterica TaxID=28901 RepID=UPI003CE78FDB
PTGEIFDLQFERLLDSRALQGLHLLRLHGGTTLYGRVRAPVSRAVRPARAHAAATPAAPASASPAIEADERQE